MTVQPTLDTCAPTRPPRGVPCPGPAAAGGRHRWRVVGTWRGNVPDDVDCWRPVLVVCRGCAHRALFSCKTRHEARCEPCGRRKRRRVMRLAEYGLTRNRSEKWAAWNTGMLTLTAPGLPGHRQWSVTGLRRRPVCTCATSEPSATTPARWNPGLARRWNHLRTVLKREYGGQLEFLRVAEVQKRGALHLHVLVVTPGHVSLPVVQAFAMAAGFGCQVDWSPIDKPQDAARYVAKYVTKDAEPGDVPWEVETVDEETGEITWDAETQARFRAWTQSHGFSMTMGELNAMAAAARDRIDRVRAEQEADAEACWGRPAEEDPHRWPVDGGALPPSTG